MEAAQQRPTMPPRPLAWNRLCRGDLTSTERQANETLTWRWKSIGGRWQLTRRVSRPAGAVRRPSRCSWTRPCLGNSIGAEWVPLLGELGRGRVSGLVVCVVKWGGLAVRPRDRGTVGVSLPRDICRRQEKVRVKRAPTSSSALQPKQLPLRGLSEGKE